MADLVRVAALTGYFPVMRELGVDPRPLLREVGLSPELLVDPEHLISAHAAVRLLERSAEASGCITLGLLMAERRDLANLGTTSILIAHQPTLRLALQALVEFRNRINSTLVLNIEESGGEALLREDFVLSAPEPTRQASNLALGVLTRLCEAALGEGWAPISACFPHEPPPPAHLPIFRRVFGCRPHFDSQVNGILVSTADLDRPNIKADSGLASQARNLIESIMSPAMRTTSQEVEEIIMLLLPFGRATIQGCAASMGVRVRTLQRMLDADQTSFSLLLNRARMQLSAQYLSNPRCRVTDVADMLGYASLSAFTRWHVQTFGVSPRQWRQVERPTVQSPQTAH